MANERLSLKNENIHICKFKKKNLSGILNRWIYSVIEIGGHKKFLLAALF